MGVIPFPPRLRSLPQQQSNAYGFPPVQEVEEALLVDQDGGRVLIRGRLFRTFTSASNATRVAQALRTLAELGCDLPEPPRNPAA